MAENHLRYGEPSAVASSLVSRHRAEMTSFLEVSLTVVERVVSVRLLGTATAWALDEACENGRMFVTMQSHL